MSKIFEGEVGVNKKLYSRLYMAPTLSVKIVATLNKFYDLGGMQRATMTQYYTFYFYNIEV